MVKKYFKKYKDIDDDYIKQNFHLHTVFSDGQNKLSEVIRKATDLCLKRIAITDHSHYLYGSNSLPFYINAIETFKKSKIIDILVGVEANVINDNGDLDTNKWFKDRFDIIIGSVHRITVKNNISSSPGEATRLFNEKEYDLSLKMIKQQKCDIIGHPGGESLKFKHYFPFKYLENIMKSCVENDIIFEISSKYFKQIKQGLIPLLEKYNPYVSFGSDAHRLENIGDNVFNVDSSI